MHEAHKAFNPAKQIHINQTDLIKSKINVFWSDLNHIYIYIIQ